MSEKVLNFGAEGSTPFTLDIERIRAEARRDVEQGALTPEYKADRKTVLKLLDAALATEWLCVLRYTQHYHAAQGLEAGPVADEFKEHAGQEYKHALKLGERIKQLGGTPHLDPSTLASRSHADYVECDSLIGMIRENLIAERIAVSSYQEMIRFLGTDDATTRRLIEEILEDEEEHADDMADLLSSLGGTKKAV